MPSACFKKSWIQPKFKLYFNNSICQYRNDISKTKSFKKKLFSITWITERKNTRQESTVNNSYIRCWNKNYFLFTSGIEMSNFNCFYSKQEKKNHLKTWNFFKASYTWISHWHFLQFSPQLSVLNSFKNQT